MTYSPYRVALPSHDPEQQDDGCFDTLVDPASDESLTDALTELASTQEEKQLFELLRKADRSHGANKEQAFAAAGRLLLSFSEKLAKRRFDAQLAAAAADVDEPCYGGRYH